MPKFIPPLALALVALLVGGIGGWSLGRQTTPPNPERNLANGPVPNADGVTQLDPRTLRGPANWYSGFSARNTDGTVNLVVEIPAGTNSKWEVEKDGVMRLELRDGVPRVVKYLPYLGNYGMIPSTKLPKDQGGDGDALDVLVLAPALPRGTVAKVRVIGMMKFLDGGEQDDKLLAVMNDTPLGKVRTLAELNTAFPGVADAAHLWFTNYKGPGKMEFKGWAEADEAMALVDRATEAARK